MTKITQFTKDNVSTVMNDLMTELHGLEVKYGIKFKRGSCTYTPGSFRVSLTSDIGVENRAEGVLTATESAYNRNRVIYGLPELGFKYDGNNGITMTVVGWNTKARKYPISLKGSDGRTYKTSADVLKIVASR